MFSAWAQSSGAQVVRDAFGNVFAIRGDWERAPGIMLGSHLDTVPGGGAYDGALGVVAGLSVLDDWDEAVPLCVAAFRAEEATRAPVGRLGSSVYAGVVACGRAAEIVRADVDADLAGLPVAAPSAPARYLELHIEQGPRLEAQKRSIAAVIGIAGYTRLRFDVEGRADHVGSTPMTMRRDALAAAAEIILHVERIGSSPADVATVGALSVSPNVVGVVPAHAELAVDVRSITDEQRTAAVRALEGAVDEVSRRRGVTVRTEEMANVPAVAFAPEVVAAVERAAEIAGASTARMMSGANHDAGNLARLCPAGMIFVPSAGGRSHTPDEYTSDEDCRLGALVLGVAARLLAQDRKAEMQA